MVHVIDTPRDVCKERFRARNELMVSEGRLQRYPTKFDSDDTWDKVQACIDSFAEMADDVVWHADSEVCSAAVLKAMDPTAHPPSRKRTRTARN